LNSLPHLLENFSYVLEFSLVVSLTLLGLVGRHLLHVLHGDVEERGETVEHIHLVITGKAFKVFKIIFPVLFSRFQRTLFF
jgi:hypothetical protein